MAKHLFRVSATAFSHVEVDKDDYWNTLNFSLGSLDGAQSTKLLDDLGADLAITEIEHDDDCCPCGEQRIDEDERSESE